jgi:DNA-directed RNA polymerase specialized sigma24 family protein
MQENRGEVTELLAQWKLGRTEALDRLLPLIYRELRRIAANQMRDERPGHTLQPTALVHEAFLRMWTKAAPIGRTGRNSSASALN